MSDGLQRAAGNKLRSVLSSLTHNRLSGLGVGAFITTIIQSSSATSVMLISFVDSGLMKFRQSVPVMMGAALGTTITIQMVALNISKYALAFVSIGFIMNFLSKIPKARNYGQILTGLGLLFLGLMLMSEAIIPLKTYQPVIHALREMENPLLGILAGIIFTAITQSASAFIGILIILGQQGLITLEASIPMLIGSNIGTSVTAIIASIGYNNEAKKVAVAHTLYRIIGALLIIWWIPSFAHIVRAVSVSEIMVGAEVAVPRQIANSHTLFYVCLTVIALPLSGLFTKLIDKMVIPKPEKADPLLTLNFLDDNMLQTPPLALSLAKQETIRMSEVVQNMLDDILLPFLVKDNKVFPEIEQNHRLANFLRDKNTEYLINISRQHIQEDNLHEAFQILSIVKEVEQIEYIISTNILPKAKYWTECEFVFSDEGKKELVQYHELCQSQLDKAIEVFRDVNLEKAKLLKKKDKEYNALVLELEQHHFSRLIGQVEESVGSSKTHIELLGLLNTISRHSTNIARILLKSLKTELQGEIK
jgi:phosphate:Na+ symporter